MPPAAAAMASRAGARRFASEQRGREPEEHHDHHGAFTDNHGRHHSAPDDGEDVLAVGVDRLLVLSVLKARRRRAAQCRSLPFSLLAYGLFVWAVLVHGTVPQHFDFERSLLDSVVGTFAPVIPSDWVTFVTTSFLPYLLPQVNAGGTPLTGEDLALTPDFGVVIGGVRISQRRGGASACPLGPIIDKVYPASCFMGGGTTTGFGGDQGFNFSLVDAAGFGDEFLPALVAGDQVGSGFHHFVNAYDNVSTSVLTLLSLISWDWIDRFTSDVAIACAVLNPELGYVAHLQLDTTFTRGGRLVPLTTLRSFSLDPYGAAPGLYVLDILMVFYVVYLSLGAVKRLVRLCCIRKGGSRNKRLKLLFSFSTALDWGTILALVAAFVTWSVFLAAISAANKLLQNMDSPIPTGAAPNADLQAFPPPWAAVEVAFGLAAASFASFKLAAVWALIFLTLRLFKYVAFQGRLSVLADTLDAAWDDLLHMGMLFGVLFLGYGVWAHFAFGAQLVLYSDGTVSTILNMFRFVMWDYDIAGMLAVDPASAPLYYVSFMIIMSNVVLWMFFAVIFENYTVVRMSAQRWPSFTDEVLAFAQAVPHMLPASPPKLCVALCGKLCCKSCGGGKPHSVAKGRATITWAEVIKLVARGALRRQPRITADMLRLHLGVTEEAACVFVSDVAATDPTFVYYGHGLRGADQLPDRMRASLQALYPHIYAKDAPADQAKGGGLFGLLGARPVGALGDEDEEADDDAFADEDEDRPSVFRRFRRFAAGLRAGSSAAGARSKLARAPSARAVRNPLQSAASSSSAASEEADVDADSAAGTAKGRRAGLGRAASAAMRGILPAAGVAPSPVGGNVVTVGDDDGSGSAAARRASAAGVSAAERVQLMRQLQRDMAARAGAGAGADTLQEGEEWADDDDEAEEEAEAEAGAGAS